MGLILLTIILIATVPRECDVRAIVEIMRAAAVTAGCRTTDSSIRTSPTDEHLLAIEVRCREIQGQ